MLNGAHTDADAAKAIELAWQAMGTNDVQAARMAAARIDGILDLRANLSPRYVAALRHCRATVWTWIQGS
jgi:hypothetical protein